jgi:hypothetical protein
MTANKSNDVLTKLFIAGLSAENIDRQKRHEYRHGHPNLTDAEIEMMFQAEQKLGRPLDSLTEAKKVLASSDIPYSSSPPLQPLS